MAKKPNFGIIGGGAVGLAYAYFLADVANVTVKTRSQAQADTINSQGGVSVIRNGESKDIHGIRATSDIADLADCDSVIVAVKTYHSKDIAAELTDVIRPDAQVVSLQNGLLAVPVLKANITNPERVFAGVTYIGARRTDERTITLGQNNRTVVDSGATVLVSALSASAFGVEPTDNIKQGVWDKLVFNTPQNALSAVTDRSIKQLLASPDCLHIAQKILEEFQAVGEAENLHFEGSLFEKVKAFWASGDDFHPSMWQDLQNGNRTEIDAINGAIAQLGARHNIATPYNVMITSLVKALESRPQ